MSSLHVSTASSKFISPAEESKRREMQFPSKRSCNQTQSRKIRKINYFSRKPEYLLNFQLNASKSLPLKCLSQNAISETQ